MGGPYPDGLDCEKCGNPIRDGEQVVHCSFGTFSAAEETIDYDFGYSDEYYHKDCYTAKAPKESLLDELCPASNQVLKAAWKLLPSIVKRLGRVTDGNIRNGNRKEVKR